MNSQLLVTIIILLLLSDILAQNVTIPFKVSNDIGDNKILSVGVNLNATDGIDENLGEAILPPLPPKEIFDARLRLPSPSTDFSFIDFRKSTILPFSYSYVYSLEVQPGNGTKILIEWNLPNETTGMIKDKFGGIVINKVINGSGSLEITNLALNKLDITINYNLITSVINESQLPSVPILYQNYPNPFNPETKIEYWIPKSGRVTLKIYDVMGREIETLVDEYQEAGKYNSQFSILPGGRHVLNSQLSSGIYFFCLKTDNYREVKKMLFIK